MVKNKIISGGRTGGKGLAMAMLADEMLARGKKVYLISHDPEKNGFIVDVDLPDNLRTPRNSKEQK